MMKRIYMSFAVFIQFLLISCNAPHNNLLDPDNLDSKYFTITGGVQSDEKAPHALSNVTVSWPNEKINTTTDLNGNFTIRCEYANNGWLVFSKTGVDRDSMYVNWGSQKNFAILKRLNALPVLDSINVYSIIRNKYSKSEYQISFEATVSDMDDDIDSVYIENTELNIYKGLQKLTSSSFARTFSDYDLALTNFNEVIGKDFNIYVKDVSKAKAFVGKASVKRIINDEIEVTSPKNSDSITTGTPTLRWKRFLPGFTFNYMLEVYTDETEPKLQWKKENISPDDISAVLDVTLSKTPDNDRFYWVVWAIDEYKNRSRSKPAGFILK